jgi:hypothetical protein
MEITATEWQKLDNAEISWTNHETLPHANFVVSSGVGSDVANKLLTSKSSQDVAVAPLKVKPYVFKKLKPAAGAYPLHFSPYRQTNTTLSRAPVSLARKEILADLQAVQKLLAQSNRTQYFEEPNCTMEPKRLATNPVKRNHAPRAASQRSHALSSLAAPQSLQEERKQMRAALKASVASLPKNDFHHEIRLRRIDNEQAEPFDALTICGTLLKACEATRNPYPARAV